MTFWPSFYRGCNCLNTGQFLLRSMWWRFSPMTWLNPWQRLMSTRSGWPRSVFQKLLRTPLCSVKKSASNWMRPPKKEQSSRWWPAKISRKIALWQFRFSMRRPTNWSYRPLAWSMKWKIVSLLTLSNWPRSPLLSSGQPNKPKLRVMTSGPTEPS